MSFSRQVTIHGESNIFILKGSTFLIISYLFGQDFHRFFSSLLQNQKSKEPAGSTGRVKGKAVTGLRSKCWEQERRLRLNLGYNKEQTDHVRKTMGRLAESFVSGDEGWVGEPDAGTLEKHRTELGPVLQAKKLGQRGFSQDTKA